MGKLVDQGDGGLSCEDRVGVHLLDHDTAVLDATPRDDLEPVEELLGLGSAVRLDEPDDEVGATRRAAMALLEHPVGLADTRRHAEVDTQPAPVALGSDRPDPSQHLVRGRATVPGPELVVIHLGYVASRPSRSRLSIRTLTRGSPRNPNSGCSVWRLTAARTSASDIARALATPATW